MIVYVDTSAAVKLLLDEPESQAFAHYMSSLTSTDEVVSSQLIETELRRTATRRDLPQGVVSEILAGIDLIEPERDFFHEAGLLPGRGLRSLDALHVITAIKTDANVVLAYDRRLVDAASAVGIATASPT